MQLSQYFFSSIRVLVRVFEPLLGFRFKRARIGHGGGCCGLGEELFELLDAVVQNFDRRIDIFALRFEGDDARLVALQRRLRLSALIDFVEIENFLDLDQREPNPLAAQDQLQPGAIAMRLPATSSRM